MKGVRYYTRCEFEIIDALKNKYSVSDLCRIMNVNQSGYYKWCRRKGTLNRKETEDFKAVSICNIFF